VVIAAVNAAVVAEVFLATRVLRAGSLGYGGMVGIWGAGMVAGTLLAPKLGRLGPLTVTGIGGLLAAVGMAAAGAAPNLAVALLAYALGGVGNGMEVAAARILVQERAGRALHGRAFSAYFAFGSSAAIAGMALGGALLGWLGARGAMELSAGLAATAGLVLVTAGARLRPAASPQPGGS
jgi:MFS family permease